MKKIFLFAVMIIMSASVCVSCDLIDDLSMEDTQSDYGSHYDDDDDDWGGSFECVACDGDGICTYCHGDGTFPADSRTCKYCHGDGICHHCDGKGYIEY